MSTPAVTHASTRSFTELETALDRDTTQVSPAHDAQQLLALAEEVLEHWIRAKGDVPALETREGFRLLALHHQGTRGVPSFNACRETCREIAYHYNLLTLEGGHPQSEPRARMMRMLVNHLLLFVRGKLEIEGLGDFCCASRPLREQATGREPAPHPGSR